MAEAATNTKTATTDGGDNTADTTTTATTTNNGEGDNNTPTVEQLMAQLAAERATNKQNKAALDKALKEKGELTKSLRAKQTAEEQAAAEKQAEDERRQQEYENAMNELNRMKAEQAYGGILTDSKSIDTVINAVADNDHKSIALLIQNEKKAAVKAAQAEWLKSRPPVNNGGGSYSGMTVEQIMSISDRTARRQAIAENQDLFK